MYKVAKENRLRFTCTNKMRHPAFSLVELMVAVGILVLMMSLAGEVFNFTVKSTGQAIALTDINRQLRMLEELLRDDLRTVQPGRSMILIQGNPTNAYWTQDNKEADTDIDPLNGYAHNADAQRERSDGNLSGEMISPRADILMIFTTRKSSSFVDPNISSNMQQIVYGHADLGEYIINPSYTPGSGDPPYVLQPGPDAFPADPSSGYPDPELVSPVPAQQWHLARRNVLLLPTTAPATGVSWTNTLNLATRNGLADPVILEGEKDVVGDFSYEQLVLSPWWSANKWYLPKIFRELDQPYSKWDKPFARSRLDVTPPALYADRLGHYLIPNCASFKVEWTLNPRSEFTACRLDTMKETYWFDPGAVLAADGIPNATTDDPLIEMQNEIDLIGNNSDPILKDKSDRLSSVLFDKRSHSDNRTYSLGNRFRSDKMNNDIEGDWFPLAPDQRANMIAFLANFPPSSGSTREDVPDDMFPSALRITVDVYDRENRLERPIRHVMIIPIGG